MARPSRGHARRRPSCPGARSLGPCTRTPSPTRDSPRFGPEQEVSIPEPLAYVPELRLLLQEKVDGPRAKEIFLADDERRRVDASVRSARWLARFHAIAPRSGR